MKKKFGIIGNPIKHSLSPVLHEYWFKKYNIDADYSIIEASDKDLPQIIEKIKQIIKVTGLSGILGNCHASGTEIIKEFGDQHVDTLHPIFYTSADSVVQIACHEEHFGLEKLYQLCQVSAEEFHPMMVGRIIARPFLGESNKNEFDWYFYS